MKGYTQTATSNSAGNRPDPCPFNVHAYTYHKAEKCAVKEARREVAFAECPSQVNQAKGSLLMS